MDTKPLGPGAVVRNRYRVTRLVAGGGMAFIYEVEELRPDGSRPVWALKELRLDSESNATIEEARRLFEQEANILVRLSHVNLPKVVAFFEEGARSYLVMEFIRGESLERHLARANAPILEGLVLDWAVQVCDVLTYLHNLPTPVIFRDMKPSNVMVTPSGTVKLVDFGIARTYKVGQRKDTVTMGSENYAAPEQWGQAQTDPRADVYGLGATMYHLLTNVPPLPAFVPAPRVPPRQYNPALSERTAAVIERAMSLDRDDRHPSAGEMRAALLECVSRRDRRRLEARSAQAARPPASPASGTRTAQHPETGAPQAPAGVPPAVPGPRQGPGATPMAPVEAPSESGPFAVPAGADREAVPAMPGPAGGVSVTSGAADAAFTRACPACGLINRPEASFCRACGTPIVVGPPPVLRMIAPARAGWEYPLRQNRVLIGRRGGSLPVDLDVGYYDPEGYISRNHVRITMHRHRYHAIDLSSANGTYVNEEPLEPGVPRLLRHDDRIRLGRVVLCFFVR